MNIDNKKPENQSKQKASKCQHNNIQQKLNISTSHQRETSSTKQITSSKEQITEKDKEHKEHKKETYVNENKQKEDNEHLNTLPYKNIKCNSNNQNMNRSMISMGRVEHNKRFESKIESKEFQKNLTNIIKQSFSHKEVSESDDD